MDTEKIWFLAEYYVICTITFIFLLMGIYSFLYVLLPSASQPDRSSPLLRRFVESLFFKLKPLFFKYKLIFQFVYFVLSLFWTFIGCFMLFELAKHQVEARYSHSLWKRFFKNIRVVGDIEIQRYEPFGVNVFKDILKNQKLSEKKLVIYEKNALIMYYHKQTKKYIIALAEMILIEYERKKTRIITDQKLLFNGLIISIPNEILNYKMLDNYSVFLEIRSLDYTTIMINYPQSPFKFELQEKVDNQKIQDRLEKILQIVRSFLL
ncbi:MAG: hypothetical protein ABDH21_04470 [bacterium]